jgi:uncharacterized secreted repeat protein (TIGR03808 family)
MRDNRYIAINRRSLLAGATALGLSAWAGAVRAQALDVSKLGVTPNSTDDQSGPLQDALLKAAGDGMPLVLPAGNYICGNLQIPSSLELRGVPGATVLASVGAAPVARLSGSAKVTIAGIGFAAGAAGPEGGDHGLLEIDTSEEVSLVGCDFSGGAANGITVRDAAVAISGCRFSGHGLAALAALESRGLTVSGNTIDRCGNGGILILAGTERHDGSRISGNVISRIGATGGGEGENGNGVRVIRCEGVIVTGNQFADCAFSAVRLGASRNVIVSQNLCRNSGDAAIAAVSGSSGTIVTDNIIEGAASGIWLEGSDKIGTTSVCSGNVVRSIRDHSEVNPAARPIGIFAETDTVVSGNTVEGIPGIGILAGSEARRRNVVVTDNVLRDVTTGIAVSVVAAPVTGPVRIAGNVLGGPPEHGIVGLDADRIVSSDLAVEAAAYPGLEVIGNSVAVATP